MTIVIRNSRCQPLVHYCPLLFLLSFFPPVVVYGLHTSPMGLRVGESGAGAVLLPTSYLQSFPSWTGYVLCSHIPTSIGTIGTCLGGVCDRVPTPSQGLLTFQRTIDLGVSVTGGLALTLLRRGARTQTPRRGCDDKTLL